VKSPPACCCNRTRGLSVVDEFLVVDFELVSYVWILVSRLGGMGRDPCVILVFQSFYAGCVFCPFRAVIIALRSDRLIISKC
jgi:hypothetical protein